MTVEPEPPLEEESLLYKSAYKEYRDLWANEKGPGIIVVEGVRIIDNTKQDEAARRCLERLANSIANGYGLAVIVYEYHDCAFRHKGWFKKTGVLWNPRWKSVTLYDPGMEPLAIMLSKLMTKGDMFPVDITLRSR